jgi:hypothetical protein
LHLDRLAVVLQTSRGLEYLHFRGDRILHAERRRIRIHQQDQPEGRDAAARRKLEVQPADLPGVGRMRRIVEQHVIRCDIAQLHELIGPALRMIQDLVDHDGPDRLIENEQFLGRIIHVAHEAHTGRRRAEPEPWL